MQPEIFDYNIKVIALDHARSIQGHFDVVDVTMLLKDAKKIEKYIREGVRE